MSLNGNVEFLESLWNQIHQSSVFKKVMSLVSNGLECVKAVPIYTRRS